MAFVWAGCYGGRVVLRGPSLYRKKASSWSNEGLLAGLFLTLALALGGGGSPAPLNELVLELLAAAIAVVWLLTPWGEPDWSRVPTAAWLIAGLVAGVPLLQLIPLPPFIWHALPGRELERGSLALIGAQDSWRAWSLAPSRTLSALLSLGPPLLLLLMTSALGPRGRITLVRIIAMMALATLVLGALQLSTGDASPAHFYGITTPMLVGFQANHNSTADLLLIALMTGPILLRDLVERRIVAGNTGLLLGIAGATIALLAFGVLLTASRMGILLLPIPLLASLWILRPWIKVSWSTLAIGLGGALSVAVLSFLLARNNPVVATIIARFDFGQELRPQLWRDGLYVAQKYFPFGVGMGNFVPALIADERLEVVWPSLPNRAHNDFLELACEAGMLGIGALSAISIILAKAMWRTLRARPGQSITLAIFAGAGLAVLALHSLVDYPFRSMALACLGAVCAGLLLTPRPEGEAAGHDSDPGEAR